MLKKRKQVKDQWLFESSITIPIEKLDDFYKIVGKFRK